MAVTIFSTPAGRAAVLTGSSLPMSFSLAGMPTQYCAVQSVAGVTQGNYQFLLTMMNFTYVYIFGEKMGDFTVTGIALQGDCDGGGSGLTNMIDFYNTAAISVTGTPLALTLAGYGAYAFLVSAAFKAEDPETSLSQFQLQLKTITQ